MSGAFTEDSRKAMTQAIMDDPQPGDLLHEMYSFWCYVVARDGDTVVTMEGNPPCTFPDDGEIKRQSIAEFRERFTYESIPDYWVDGHSRNNDVEGWLVKALEKHKGDGR